MTGFSVEICAASIHSAMAAQEGGAHRVELCDNLVEGGTTPSYGIIQAARDKLKIRLHVLIRPRGGDFLYTPDELDIIRLDILKCKELGVDGIVTGFLNGNGCIDTKLTREMISLARPMSVTFHRAFDMTRDPFEALLDIQKTGADRILSSGQQDKAWQGRSLIRELGIKSDNSPIIMAGAGLTEENIREFAAFTGIKEFHATLRSKQTSRMQFRKDGVSMGGSNGIHEYEILETNAQKVRQFISELEML